MIEVVCGVIQDNFGKILITQRGGREYCGKWEFPGGKIEPHETIFESIQREIMEELKLNITPVKKIISYPYKKFNLQFIYCKAMKEKPVLTEHLDYKWIDFSELVNFDFLEGDVKFVSYLLTNVKLLK